MYLNVVLELCLSLFLFFSCIHGQNAPYDPSPFIITGKIDGMTRKDTGTLSGGTITIDSIVVTIPDNLLATLPSITVAWGELFQGSTPNLPGTGSWQATIYGNRVSNQYIAGIISIAQSQNQILQGFIDSIDSTTGHFKVAGRDCVLNDPIGQFGPAYTDNPLWSVDPFNPSVRASTGFPMCIPRSANDPLCPATNRPVVNGQPVQQLTFGDPTSISPGQPDPHLMMPLAAGDYITFSGIDLGDLFAVYSLEANLGIFTKAGTKPAYINVESAIYAVVQGAPNTEDGETRAVAFSTDTAASLSMSAIDIDPCTGATKNRLLITVQGETVQPVGEAVFRGGKTDFSPATQSMFFQITTGTSPGPENITAGAFVQPIFDYTFPEILLFGAPEVPLGFELIPYLAQGSGPYVPGNLLTPPLPTPPIVGQLDPWPGATAPATTSCPAISATTSAAPTSTPGPGGPSPDTITILSATSTKGRGGLSTLAVHATTNNPSATLSCSAAGTNAVPPTLMTKNADGSWSFNISVKGNVNSVTVTSDKGGSTTTAV